MLPPIGGNGKLAELKIEPKSLLGQGHGSNSVSARNNKFSSKYKQEAKQPGKLLKNSTHHGTSTSLPQQPSETPDLSVGNGLKGGGPSKVKGTTSSSYNSPYSFQGRMPKKP